MYEIAAVPMDHLAWLVKRTDVELTTGFQAISAMDTTHVEECNLCGQTHPRIVGMIGYSNWTPNSVSVHIALDTPLAARTLAKHIYKYPFEQAGRKIMYGLVRASNRRVNLLAKHAGFVLAHVAKDGWSDGEDLNLYRKDK